MIGQQWYYGRGTEISGPVSSRILATLAASGELHRTDTVWMDEVEQGMPANRVRNLFTTTEELPADLARPEPVADAPPILPAGSPVADPPAVPADLPTPPRPVVVKRARAVAGKGAVIVGQDGATVRFRMRCTVCGKEDGSWKSMTIPRGTARVSFFCPKCRKRRDTEIHGYH